MDGTVTYTANNMDEKRKRAKIAFIVMMIVFAVSVCIKHIVMGSIYWDMKDEVPDLFVQIVVLLLFSSINVAKRSTRHDGECYKDDFLHLRIT